MTRRQRPDDSVPDKASEIVRDQKRAAESELDRLLANLEDAVARVREAVMADSPGGKS